MTPNETIEMLRQLNINKYDDTYDIHEKIANYRDRVRPDLRFSVDDGSSKICLIIKNAPFVIKWAYGDDRYDEAYEEALMYKKAVEKGLERFFPKTALLCEINGIKFVAQTKIDTCIYEVTPEDTLRYERITKTAKEKLVRKMETEFKKNAGGYGRDLDVMWGKMALVLYGKRVCQKLCKFIQENGINDLHGSNIGYKDNRPIILDFSGYHRDDY